MLPQLLVLFVAVCLGDECDWAPSPDAKQNLYPIDTAPLVFSHNVPNGKAYVGGQPGFQFFVAHVYGNSYEMGKAHGQLFPAQIIKFLNSLWAWLEKQVEEELPKTWPAWFAELVANDSLELALDTLYALDAPFIGENIKQEMQGLADGSGVDPDLLRRVHLIGELTQGQCSLLGAWGNVTQNGHTFMMRSFDWNADCPCRNYPAIIVYHPTPNSGSGQPWLNIGWTGFLGTFTAMSSVRTAAAMIGVEFPDSTFGKESFVGVPFLFLLRDIAQFDVSYVQAIDRIRRANRTCDLIFGLGDGNAGLFRGVEYSASVANVFDDTNMMPYNETWHPRMPQVLYWGMDWLCPTFTSVLAAGIQRHYGNLTPEVTILDISSKVQTGNVHEAIFDLTDNILYVSFEGPDNSTVPGLPPFAYDRQFTRLNATELFLVQL